VPPPACCLAVYAHHVPHICSDLGLAAEAVIATKPTYVAACLALLAAPGAVAAAAHALPAGAISQQISALAAAAWRRAFSSAASSASDARPAQVAPAAASSSQQAVASTAGAALQQGSPEGFVHAAYGYMPFVWAALLVHFLEPLGLEAGTLLRVAARMVGWAGGASSLPVLMAHPEVVNFLQVGAGGGAVDQLLPGRCTCANQELYLCVITEVHVIL
jgi:hypothetical protein